MIHTNHDEWKAYMRLAIQAASIVRYAHDHMAEGRGVPGVEEMRGCAEEAEAIVKLWEEAMAAP